MPSSLLASSGIGQATALLLAEAGVQFVLVSRRGEPLQQLAGGGTAIAIPSDITNCQQVQAMVQTVLDKFARIDILGNPAWAFSGVSFAISGPIPMFGF
ncbi:MULTISPECIES: SDR family oxidoreductase [Laspinema]|uniref:SDR family oxidoreductase n=1 Tax=Laspinema TaxID=2584823 RepID=UPI0021BB23E3|nr:MULTISPECIES: SDR family NAD(P)-dependent oxidoreductase [unclassified Laspinema]MCT7964316.1 SDR family NAD(P)-dependent oxidoreductase [Laspinema sp. D2b]MCT7975722.1 SDR family NAD(P)-dependent oxidoreductase [Laspinema sp. D3d]MCT7989047.1 SDR family NAD(P)-dependent oxidoreductase [Laspinema sp. D3a]MCT7997447.1 SDR family NAD(P)-dependent oxidoreductase [Laspinema sp. D3c]